MLKPKNIDFSKEHYGILVERKDSVEFCEMGRLFYIKLIERNYENGTIYLTFKSNKMVNHISQIPFQQSSESFWKRII